MKIPVYVVSLKEFETKSGICVGDRVVYDDGDCLRYVHLYPVNDEKGNTINHKEVEFEFNEKDYCYRELDRQGLKDHYRGEK